MGAVASLVLHGILILGHSTKLMSTFSWGSASQNEAIAELDQLKPFPLAGGNDCSGRKRTSAAPIALAAVAPKSLGSGLSAPAPKGAISSSAERPEKSNPRNGARRSGSGGVITPQSLPLWPGVEVLCIIDQH